MLSFIYLKKESFMKIAIIGAGISGLGAAYLLNPHHDIRVYERNACAGGHSRTIEVPAYQGNPVPVDTGFIVYNERNYFHLTRLFRHLDVPVQKSAMSFGASIQDGWLEYSSTGLFAQKSNLVRPAFWGMVRDILSFNRAALACVQEDEEISLRECLDKLQMGEWFRRYYLQAMGAAIWSCSVETIEQFPARTFLQFFENHGLLTINDHPQWYTVEGGSRSYVARLTKPFADKIVTGCAVRAVKRHTQGVQVVDRSGRAEDFDKVVFACHADEVLTLLEAPSTLERDILGSFRYQDNEIYVHRDESFMPRRKACWASWNYLSQEKKDSAPSVSLTYWMNNLQNLKTDHALLVTLNPGQIPEEGKIYERHRFSHPIFDLPAIRAQKRIGEIQGRDNAYFCGAYQRYGFHEDGLLSAVNVAVLFGITPPWV
jgi:uncharacterized protein